MAGAIHSNKRNRVRWKHGNRAEKRQLKEGNTCANHDAQCTGDSLLPDGVEKAEVKNRWVNGTSAKHRSNRLAQIVPDGSGKLSDGNGKKK
jgi:hypothetical protein